MWYCIVLYFIQLHRTWTDISPDNKATTRAEPASPSEDLQMVKQVSGLSLLWTRISELRLSRLSRNFRFDQWSVWWRQTCCSCVSPAFVTLCFCFPQWVYPFLTPSFRSNCLLERCCSILLKLSNSIYLGRLHSASVWTPVAMSYYCQSAYRITYYILIRNITFGIVTMRCSNYTCIQTTTTHAGKQPTLYVTSMLSRPSNPALSVRELLFSQQIIQNWDLKVNTGCFSVSAGLL